RNSLQMLAQSHFSHRQLQKKNTPAMHEMLHKIGVNWADLPSVWKNGVFISKRDDDSGGWDTRYDMIFKRDRVAVEKYFYNEE
ncbi:MAG: hypothetical protein KAR20_24080, partial [Candidatus Heimdallarchaeota archaeon]|nr:hypothetical protein [Candidatus Heimdallarchaeota archaeon]